MIDALLKQLPFEAIVTVDPTGASLANVRYRGRTVIVLASFNEEVVLRELDCMSNERSLHVVVTNGIRSREKVVSLINLVVNRAMHGHASHAPVSIDMYARSVGSIRDFDERVAESGCSFALVDGRLRSAGVF